MMKLFGKHIVVLISLTVQVISVSAQEIELSLTVSDILTRVIDTYGDLDTYQDRGQVTTHILGDTNIRLERPFTTAFVRPGKFRFEYQRLSGIIFKKFRVAYIVWQDDDKLAKYFHARPEERSLISLGRGIAGATGVSGGSAHAIPPLLLPDLIGGRRPTDIQNPTREPDEDFDGNDCFVISGGTTTNSTKLWISKHDFLIRKIERYVNQQIEANTIIVYDPTMNKSIESELLDFNAPRI